MPKDVTRIYGELLSSTITEHKLKTQNEEKKKREAYAAMFERERVNS